MALDTQAAYAAVVAVVTALSGVQRVYQGVPESIGNQVVAIVTVGGQRVLRRMSGGAQVWEQRFVVTFAYRVGAAESTAEATIAQLIDRLRLAILDDRNLDGTVSSADVDLSLADGPEYELRAGQEFRRYPVAVVTEQIATINPL